MPRLLLRTAHVSRPRTFDFEAPVNSVVPGWPRAGTREDFGKALRHLEAERQGIDRQIMAIRASGEVEPLPQLILGPKLHVPG